MSSRILSTCLGSGSRVEVHLEITAGLGCRNLLTGGDDVKNVISHMTAYLRCEMWSSEEVIEPMAGLLIVS